MCRKHSLTLIYCLLFPHSGSQQYVDSSESPPPGSQSSTGEGPASKCLQEGVPGARTDVCVGSAGQPLHPGQGTSVQRKGHLGWIMKSKENMDRKWWGWEGTQELPRWRGSGVEQRHQHLGSGLGWMACPVPLGQLVSWGRGWWAVAHPSGPLLP